MISLAVWLSTTLADGLAQAVGLLYLCSLGVYCLEIRESDLAPSEIVVSFARSVPESKDKPRTHGRGDNG